ncbi:MAG: hypothetical protein KKG47_05785 [Proteobacteria bacterium]|nr:hypothetical protein [Pseudomonadota bacterium]MBU1736984.1 hypothetical protein [Pseudomonadota bacterium]
MAATGTNSPLHPKILIIYYSFSGQTIGLLNSLASGLKANGAEVVMERIHPLVPPRFPVGSFIGTLKMMLTTFFRMRLRIREPEITDCTSFDLIVLAGPTWSYNPSGPILDLLDRFGPLLFTGKQVLPLISCRGYWRMHWLGLKSLLLSCGAVIPNRMVFSHPAEEPWRTVGVFLKIAGKAPERSKYFSRYYSRYGHSKEQLAEAEKFGAAIAAALSNGKSLSDLDFQTGTALP